MSDLNKEQNTNGDEAALWSGKLSFLNSSWAKLSILLFCLLIFIAQDIALHNQLDKFQMYIGPIVGAGIANCILKRKQEVPAHVLFLNWASLTAFLMLLMEAIN